MFEYKDPTGEDFLGLDGVRNFYRASLAKTYKEHAEKPSSGFTWLEAFSMAEEATTVSPSWKAFPVTADVQDNAAIDGDRFRFQDEYVEVC